MISIFTDTDDFDIQPKVDLWLLVLSLSYKVIPLGWDVFNFFSYVFAWQDKLHKRSTIFIQDFWKVFGLFHGLNCAGMAVESTLLHRFVIFLFRVCLFVQVIQWQFLSSFPVFSLFSGSYNSNCFHHNIVLSNCSACVTVFLNNNWMKATRKCLISTA